MLKILEIWSLGQKLGCCPALELFHCLPLWKTKRISVFHRGRQWKSSRAGQQRPFSDLNFKFQVFSTPGFRFSTWQKKVTLGGKNHFYATKAILILAGNMNSVRNYLITAVQAALFMVSLMIIRIVKYDLLDGPNSKLKGQ